MALTAQLAFECGLDAGFRGRSSQVVHLGQLVGGTVSAPGARQWLAKVARVSEGGGWEGKGVGAKPASSRQLQRGAPAPAGQPRHAASWEEQAQPHNPLNHPTALVHKMCSKALLKRLERTFHDRAMF